MEACDVDAIDFDMMPEEVELDVGSILVAVGFQEFDARKLGNYGYGRLPNVGHQPRARADAQRFRRDPGARGAARRTSKTPKRIVFIQCVGARGEGGRPYCSRFCCMNAVKDSMLIRQHDPEVEDITILYTDLRAFGKGFDDFVKRSNDEQSANYVRGRPAKVDPHARRRHPRGLRRGHARTRAEDGSRPTWWCCRWRRRPTTAPSSWPRSSASKPTSTDSSPASDPAISAVETTREGIFVCGSAVGPQVIPDCVAQASATAARAQLYLTGHRVEEEEATVEPMDLSGPPRVGVMVCHCGINIAGVLDVDELADYAGSLPDVVVATTDLFACSSTGQDELVETDQASTGSTGSWSPPAHRAPTSRSSARPARASVSTPTCWRWSTSATSAPGCTPSSRTQAQEKAKR